MPVRVRHGERKLLELVTARLTDIFVNRHRWPLPAGCNTRTYDVTVEYMADIAHLQPHAESKATAAVSAIACLTSADPLEYWPVRQRDALIGRLAYGAARPSPGRSALPGQRRT